MSKKVLRYTEEEFITLLENIVKRVKKEEALNEARKSNRARINENTNRRSRR